MQKPISRRTHGLLDYLYVVFMVMAPWLSGFADQSTAVLWCFVIAGWVLAVSLSTGYEWGAIYLIPFRQHLWDDFVVGVLTLSVPWLFHFADNLAARNTFIVFGMISIAASLLSRAENLSTQPTHPLSV